MAITQLFFFVFYTVLVTGIWSFEPPDFSHLPQEERIREWEKIGRKFQNKSYTLDEAVKIRVLMEDIKTFDIETVVKICSILVSSNFTSVEREPIQNKSFDILSFFSLVPFPFYEIEEAQLYKNVLCSYISHPTEDVKHAEALGLSMIPYFKLEHIRKRNNSYKPVLAARQLCDAFYSVGNLANLNSNPIELSENQIGEFKELWNQVEHLDWDKSPRLVVENLCNLLNVKISSEEQANALEITVDLYSSVLKGLKELVEDNSIQNRVNVYRQICRDINLSFGYSELYVSRNGTLTTDDQIKHFSSYTLRVESYGNKWKSIKNVCVYLNETVSIKYIAENAGLSDDQLAENTSYMPDDDENNEFLTDNLKSQLLQTMNLCNVIKSEKVTLDHLCRCPPGFEGNALVECKPVKTPVSTASPCQPSPCWPNSQCRELNDVAVCSCLPAFIGRPPTCRPESPVSTASPCQPSPCGPNSQCRELNDVAVCSCLPAFIGRPPTCRPECIVNSDCPVTLACFNQTCRDPCIDVCGIGAKCEVSTLNHRPICSCPSGYTGNPLAMCQPISMSSYPLVEQPGQNSTNPCTVNSDCPVTEACFDQRCSDPCIDVCGIGARCKVNNHHPVCSCSNRYTGDPLNMCQPIMECVRNSDCALNKACIRNMCENPCKGACSQYTQCEVVNHFKHCSCLAGYDGNHLTECKIQECPVYEETTRCIPNPCGSNAICRERNGEASCQCLPEFFGNPYEGCRSECVLDSDCPSNKACVGNKCQNPCEYACGQNTKCEMVNHLPSCTCSVGFTGDPYRLCTIQQTTAYNQSAPCMPNSCGSNAICLEQSGIGSCQCLPEFFGNPYEGCRPECVLNSDCASNKACIRNKCQNPCEYACGQNTECEIVNHLPSCKCRLGYIGDPYNLCKVARDDEYVIPCFPSPCGANSFCYEMSGQAVCSCLQNSTGNPPGCSFEKPCDTCGTNVQDPCPGLCGTSAECILVNHVPIFHYTAGMEHQMEKFVFEASKIFLSPLADRLELLRGVCKTNFRLSTFPQLNSNRNATLES